MKPALLRLIVLFLGLGWLVAASLTSAGEPPAYPNPLVLQRADPWIHRHTDGWYYFMGTVPEYDRLELRRAKTVAGLATADTKVIWKKHTTGILGAHIWAPEIHFIDGKWYVYFAAGAAEKVWDIRIYVLENSSPNPLEGEWIEKGQLRTGWESFSLDASTFEHRGQRYLLWTQRHPDIKGTNIYLAKMDTPWSISTPAVLLSKPEFPWEQVRYWVNEGPTVLHRHGRLSLTYSAAGTGAEYCLGLLTAGENADLLDPKSWVKSPTRRSSPPATPTASLAPDTIASRPRTARTCSSTMRAITATSPAIPCATPTATPACKSSTGAPTARRISASRCPSNASSASNR